MPCATIKPPPPAGLTVCGLTAAAAPHRSGRRRHRRAAEPPASARRNPRPHRRVAPATYNGGCDAPVASWTRRPAPKSAGSGASVQDLRHIQAGCCRALRDECTKTQGRTVASPPQSTRDTARPVAFPPQGRFDRQSFGRHRRHLGHELAAALHSLSLTHSPPVSARRAARLAFPLPPDPDSTRPTPGRGDANHGRGPRVKKEKKHCLAARSHKTRRPKY